jgi:CRP-like cAMP-binding protein
LFIAPPQRREPFSPHGAVLIMTEQRQSRRLFVFAYRDKTPTGNSLIDSLGAGDRDLLGCRLQSWEARAGQVIFEPGAHVDHAYFPIGQALASFRIGFEDGSDVETGLIGREGALGGIVSHGHLPAFARSVAQVGGDFARIPLTELERLKENNSRIRELFNRYADCLMAQCFQATACNAAHSVEQRAAKWLLAAADRTGSHDFTLTQDQLAGLLGVGRSYVSRLIGKLRGQGVISNGRSRIRIEDPHALRRLSCECDACVRRHFDEVLRGVAPAARAGAA